MKNSASPASHPIKFPAILKIFLAFGSLHFLPVISGTRIIFRFPGKQGRCVVPLRLERVGEVIRAHPCNPWQNHLRQQNPFVSFFGKIHPALNNSKPHTTTQLSQACAQLSSPLRGGRRGAFLFAIPNHNKPQQIITNKELSATFITNNNKQQQTKKPPPAP